MDNEVDTKALNEKLAIFCGFKKLNEPEWSQNEGKTLRWVYPDGHKMSLLPQLVNSLDAQSKWIYPKLIKDNLRITKDYNPRMNIWKVEIYNTNNEGLSENKSEALAFAFAVSRYIDSLDGNHNGI